MKAIILAGGRGTRLAPYTTVLPKPLMPIGDMPIVDIVIRQLARHGFDDITLATGHLAELLTAYCGDGSKYHVKLDYSREDAPLGTAGPIALVPGLTEAFLVMNGDLLTTLSYRDLWQHHRDEGAIATLATFPRSVRIDLGVVESDAEHHVTSYTEKPTIHYRVSTGVYIFEPAVLRYITRGERLDLPDLILLLLEKGERVCAYEFHGYWLDIGRHEDYETAIRLFETHRESFLPGP